MPTIPFRDREIELLTDIEALDLDSAEILESELGLDLRDLGRLPKVRLFKTLTLISARQHFPDATMAEVGKLPLGALLGAFSAQGVSSAPVVEGEPSGRQVDFTGSVVLAPAVEDSNEVLSPSNAGSDDSSATRPARKSSARKSSPSGARRSRGRAASTSPSS